MSKKLTLRMAVCAIAALGSRGALAQTASDQTPSHTVANPALGAIRHAGIQESRAMSYLTELADGIGPRLTGSPNLAKAYDWAQRTFRSLGADNVHLEDAGEFGLGWRQKNAWLRMAWPDQAVLVAQAIPWSASSHGPQEGEAVAVELHSADDFRTYHGRLRGKIVLLGPMRDMPPTTEVLTQTDTEGSVVSGRAAQPQRTYHQRRAARQAQASVARQAGAAGSDFEIETARFLAREGVLAVVVPTANMPVASGTTGLVVVDGSAFAWGNWTAETRTPYPVLITTREDFGRSWRLSKRGTPVRLGFDVDTEVTDEHAHAYNVVAELPGTDQALKSEIVILGAHLDSWPGATGAGDNGAGVAATIEALRILKTSGVKLRRTVRFILYAGEEQGLLGSIAYARTHLARPRDAKIRAAATQASTAIMPLAEYRKVSAAYNIDDGTGRIEAVFSGGNRALADIYRAWLPDLQPFGVKAVYDEPSYFSDQGAYLAVGVPGISFLQERLDYFTRTHHSNLDTIEHIVPSDLAQVATVASVFVLKTANHDTLMPRAAPIESAVSD